MVGQKNEQIDTCVLSIWGYKQWSHCLDYTPPLTNLTVPLLAIKKHIYKKNPRFLLQ